MIRWVDQLKGFAIILVILGHCISGEDVVRPFIYSFHMPLFYFVAGFLFYMKSKAIDKISALNKVKRYFRRLMLPYYFWGLLNWLVCCVVCFFVYPDSFVKAFRLIANFMIGRGGAGLMELSLSNVPIWFLPSLFVLYLCLLSLNFIKRKYKLISALSVSAFGVFLSTSGFRLPFKCELALMSLPFALLGGGIIV